MTIRASRATEADLLELADVAARTFPLACPPTDKPGDIVSFIEENLSHARFREYFADPERTLLVARANDRIVGYTMLINGIGKDADVEKAVTLRPAVELSKFYVLSESHGAGVAAVLMEATLERARELGATCVWLGVNQQNERARRFYGKQGFTVNGTKRFQLGTTLEDDYVMVRRL
jgi:ribosomal protein S18 acetylase RimI-like enzyme